MSQPGLFYLDHNATTPVAPEVIEAMLPVLKECWANPSSPYRIAREAARHREKGRLQVAALLNADPREIVFTSCGTESNNAAIHSALMLDPSRRHVATTAVEHSANLRFCQSLERRGYEVTYLPVATDGSLDLAQIERAIRPDTAIVSVMWANNETGTLYPVGEIAAICRRKGVPFHTDAVQAAGKIAIDVKAIDVDFLSLSAHKFCGPKGIGALYVRRRTRFWPYVVGGRQEGGRRGGTENVAHIVGFGRAAEVAMARVSDVQTRVRTLRDRLEDGILASIPRASRNGAAEPRLPNTCNVALADLDAESVLMKLDQLGVCASSGSACTTGSLAPSHVLIAMGLSPTQARSSIRLSLGPENTDAEVDYVLQHLIQIVAKLRTA